MNRFLIPAFFIASTAYADGPTVGLDDPHVTPPPNVCERQLIPNTNVYAGCVYERANDSFAPKTSLRPKARPTDEVDYPQ